MGYTRFYTTWRDFPDVSTPTTAAFYQALEDALAASLSGSSFVPLSTVAATGDLIVGTGSAAVSNLTVGAAGTVLHGGSTPSYSQIVNADVSNSASVAYSKLNLANSVVNADVNSSASIAYSKLNLAGSITSADIADGTIVNGDINASASIAYSKLNLAGSIVNADINASAAIAASKLSGYPSDSTKFLRGDGTWAAASGTTYRKTTSKQVVNTVTETDLLNGEITVAANAIGTSGVLRLTAWGDWKQNSGASSDIPRFKLKLGATTILDTSVLGATSANNNTSRFGWRVRGEIMNLGAANSQWATLDGDLNYGQNNLYGIAAFATGEGQVSTLNSGAANSGLAKYLGGASSAVDTTSAQVLALTVILPTASASTDIILKGALIEIV